MVRFFRRLRLVLILLLIVTVFLFFWLRSSYRDVVRELAQTQVKNSTSDLTNDAIARQIADGVVQYDRIVYFEGVAIPANADVNTYKTPGMYYSTGSSISSTLTNIPPSAAEQMFVMQVYSDGENYFQILTYHTSYVVNMFVRRTENEGASWMDWRNSAPTLMANLTTTNTGYALDATMGKELNDKFSEYARVIDVGRVTSSARTKTIRFRGTCHFVLAAVSESAPSRTGAWMCSCSAEAGAIKEMAAAGDLTIAYSAPTLTATTNTFAANFYMIVISGAENITIT